MQVDMFSVLNSIVVIRKRIDRNRKNADALYEKATSIGVSNVYKGVVGKSYNHTAPQELLAEVIDLRKSVFNDLNMLYDVIAIIEDEVDAIPDYDTRVIIKNKYLNGWSDEEVEELFCEHESGYCYILEQDYFRSLKEGGSDEAS